MNIWNHLWSQHSFEGPAKRFYSTPNNWKTLDYDRSHNVSLTFFRFVRNEWSRICLKVIALSWVIRCLLHSYTTLHRATSSEHLDQYFFHLQPNSNIRHATFFKFWNSVPFPLEPETYINNCIIVRLKTSSSIFS